MYAEGANASRLLRAIVAGQEDSGGQFPILRLIAARLKSVTWAQ
jgi:hypothetical protein